MAVEFFARKLHHSLAVFDQDGCDAIAKLVMNGVYKVVVSQIRNYKFHQKFFCLLNVAYNAWEAPHKEHNGVQVFKNKKRFRKDITILCGYYEVVVDIKGQLRTEALSISFASMSQDDFDSLYSKAIQVILDNVLTHYTRDDLDRVVSEVLRFA